MAEAVLRRMKMSWALLSLGLVICKLSFLPLAESTNPLLDTDILQVYNVMNVHQCQRLCWYRKLCARYSFYSMDDNSEGKKDNCVLHVTEGQTQGQLEGWILAKASSKRMPPDHGCLARPCSDTEICVPYTGAVSFQCIPAPGSEIDECASSPCQNEGSCVDKLNAYTCTCPAGYNGTHCETDLCSHYTVLDDATRDVTWGSSPWRCDKDITAGWYRFLLNGRDAVMPTECTPEKRCGTRATYWLDMQGEKLPAVRHETAARACGSLDSCCQTPIPVTVRNCGSFYLYHLQPVRWCTAGYCAETQDNDYV